MNDLIKKKLEQSMVVLNQQHLLIQRLANEQGVALRCYEIAAETQSVKLVHVLDIFNYVFALIDHLVRFHKLAHGLPCISHRSLEFRFFDDATGELKEIRNQIQHLNNEVRTTMKAHF